MPQSTTLHDLSKQQTEEVAALRKEIEDTDDQIRDLDRKLKPLKATKKRLVAKLRDREKQAAAIAQLHEGLASADPTRFLRTYAKLTVKPKNDKELAEAYAIAEAVYRARAAEIKRSFAVHFPEACASSGLPSVEGDEIKGFTIHGLLVAKVNWDKATSYVSTTISSTPPRTVPSVDVHDIVTAVMQLHTAMFGRQFDPNRFIEQLADAYLQVAGVVGKDVTLKEVQPIISDDLAAFSVDVGKLINSEVTKTRTGLAVHFSSGMGGLPVYDIRGGSRTYKFIRFSGG